MAYCGPAAIPHSWFLGGPFRWTPEDRAKALAWAQWEQACCKRCGKHPSEELDGYDVEMDRCRLCEKIDATSYALSKDEGHQFGVKLAIRRQEV